VIPTPLSFIQQVLLDAVELEAESLALDYVEQILGRRYFQDHWARLSPEDQHRSVTSWLEHQDQGPLADQVLAELDRLFAVNAKWPR
jgi:hypothetical protein